MRLNRLGILAPLALVVMTATAYAQSKTITGEAVTMKGTIEAIEASTRTVTLKKPDGTFVTTVAPPELTRFSELRIGDTITAKYYESLIIRLKTPGEPDVDRSGTAASSSGQTRPGGTKSTQRTITATIIDIDRKIPSITFTGPNGWKYSSRVEDKAALAWVNVGDRVEMTWTEAVLLSVQ